MWPRRGFTSRAGELPRAFRAPAKLLRTLHEGSWGTGATKVKWAMSSDWNIDKASRDEAKARTLALMEDRDRPVLIGEVALACGTLWGIEDAERLLEELVMERVIERVPGALEQYGRVKG